MNYRDDDPFCPSADPYFQAIREPDPALPAVACHCGNSGEPTDQVDQGRRRALIVGGLLMVAPLNAAASAIVPCVQTRQRITPCRHKYCKHYRGRGDYHGR